jgi:hypothetical protein
VGGVVGFIHGFAAIVEPAVAKDEAKAAESAISTAYKISPYGIGSTLE